MKTKILFLTIGTVFFLCGSCGQQNTNKSKTKNGTPTTAVDSPNLAEISDNYLTVSKTDTVIGRFQISYLIKENGDTIYRTGIDGMGNSYLDKYPDRSVFLTLKHDGNMILSNKKIGKKDFDSIIPSDKINEFQLWSFFINHVDEQEVSFRINNCVPETDFCYLIELSVSNKGDFTLQEIDLGEMGD